MKYHFLGTFGALATVMGITATTARADVSFSIPSGGDSGQESQSSTARSTPNQPNRNLQSTSTPVMNSLELTTHNLVNRYRQYRNLPPLVVDPDISAQAKAHSEEMARSGNMNHDGFDRRADLVSKTIVYRSVAENIAFNAGHGQPDLVAVKGWIESPGHQRNMVGRYDLTGIGVVQNAKGEYYFTQIFIRKAWYAKDAD
ncbi:CAP domain-containing protein [Chamaesiphon sp.]|uniref:CAP domain-containing protein n=1 Tax=Chamaesiphon sp. TaxID=2814140 RepID=UPI0035931B77